MKRCSSSTSVIDTEREKKNTGVVKEEAIYEENKKKKKKKKNEGGVVYGVFEDFVRSGGQYFIYKLDSWAGEDDDAKELTQQQPIETFTSLPSNMFFFSVDSKLYLCGGDAPGGRSTLLTAYMLDINSSNNNNGNLVSIASMNSPKPDPLVFGPIDGYKFYVFSLPLPHQLPPDLPTFEMFDTNTNTWESLLVPSYLCGLEFKVSAICASNILLYPEFSNDLVVFCTRTRLWRKLPLCYPPDIPDPFLPPALRLPFEKGHSLFYQDNIHYILTSGDTLLPRVYSIKNDDLDHGPVATFHKLGYVDGFSDHMKLLLDFLDGWGMIINSFSLNDNSTMCIVRTGTYGYSYEHFAINILDVRYVLLENPTKVKVEVENTLKYTYRTKSRMEPRHFLHLVA